MPRSSQTAPLCLRTLLKLAPAGLVELRQEMRSLDGARRNSLNSLVYLLFVAGGRLSLARLWRTAKAGRTFGSASRFSATVRSPFSEPL